MYLTAACLPLLRPVIEKVIPEKWKGAFRTRRLQYSNTHGPKSRSNFTMHMLGLHDGKPDGLEMGCGSATLVNEVNGCSVSETCLVHPGAIEVTNEISVSVTCNSTTDA
jgi:hypothetical protein